MMEAPTFNHPKSGKGDTAAGKVMASIFWDFEGLLLGGCLQTGKCINRENYADLLKRMRDNIKQKRPGMLTKGIPFHQANAPAHNSVAMAKSVPVVSSSSHIRHTRLTWPLRLTPFPRPEKDMIGRRNSTDDDVINLVSSYVGRPSKEFYLNRIKDASAPAGEVRSV